MALTTAFCANGDKTPIPPTADDGSVSYDQGFGASYALPPEEGGKFIDRAQFNQLMYDTTSQVLANKTAIATKANASEVVKLTTNQNIQGVKTFAAPPVSATNPTANNQVANKAYVDSVGNTAVKLTGNQKIAGVKTFTNNIVSPNITAMQDNLNTIFSSTLAPVKTQTGTKEITVGTDGDFADILSAIAEARKYTSMVQIKFVSDLRTSGNISINNLNGLNIEIYFNNFKLINTNSDNVYHFVLQGSTIGAISNLHLIGYTFTILSNSSTALKGETATINNSQYASADCFEVARSSSLAMSDNLQISVLHKGDRRSFGCLFGSIIAFGANITVTDNSTDGECLLAIYGGIINASTVTINSSIPKANQAANTATANGIIFGNYSL